MNESINIPIVGCAPLCSLDDDPMFHFVFKRAYRKSGLKNELVFHNRKIEFFDWIDKQVDAGIFPSALILDINMPDANGIHVSCELKSRFSDFEPLNIILLTSSSSRADKDSAVLAGIENMLVKPTSIKDYNFICIRSPKF